MILETFVTHWVYKIFSKPIKQDKNRLQDFLSYSKLLMVFCLFYEQRNVLRKQRNWERQVAAKKSKRKEEKQRKKLNREQESGEDQVTHLVLAERLKVKVIYISVYSFYNQNTCLYCVFVIQVQAQIILSLPNGS